MMIRKGVVMHMKRVVLIFVLFFQLSNAIPFLRDEKNDTGIVPVLDTMGMQWRDDLSYLTYLCMDELGQLSFRTYPFTSISMPGSYQLAGDVSNQITISASNVSLDMQGHTVSGGTSGIVINSGLNNVTIKNGVVDSVSSNGIQVGAGCSNITIKDVQVKNAIRGINVNQVTNGLIKNCDFNVSTTGLLLDACRNITVHNCTARANTHAGYDILSSTTCNFIECSALSTGQGNNALYGNNVFGFVSANGNGNIFERCIANSTQALSTTDSNSLIAGFALRGSESCTQIIDSESANAQTSPYGLTIPYGIWLEETIDSTQSVTGGLGPTGRVLAIEFSPDGKYIAIGGDGNATNGLKIVSFDRVSKTIANITNATGRQILVLDWSKDGKYIAIGQSNVVTNQLELFTFDSTTETLTSVDVKLAGSTYISAMHFSPDVNYLVCGGNTLSGGLQVQIFRVNKESKTLTFVTGILTAGIPQSTRWSPDGKYIFVGGDGLTGSNELQILKFNRTTETVTTVASALPAGQVTGGEWSPDGEYLSVGGISLTGGTLQIFKFNRTTETLSTILSTSPGTQVWSARWTSDGKYLAISGVLTSNKFQIWRFNRSAQTITKVAEGLGTAGISAYELAWAPDGLYVAVVGDNITPHEFQIFSGLRFPEKNVIKGNTVYCNSGGRFPSGIGISAPSISNMVIGNTAFNNPIPRGANAPIVELNYAFVTNVFNQLFGDAPTALQSISLSGIDPIWDRYDIPTGLNRLEALAESLIDNLL